MQSTKITKRRQLPFKKPKQCTHYIIPHTVSHEASTANFNVMLTSMAKYQSELLGDLPPKAELRISVTMTCDHADAKFTLLATLVQ